MYALSETGLLYLIVALLSAILAALIAAIIGFEKGYNLRVEEYNSLRETKTRDIPIYVTEDKNMSSNRMIIMPKMDDKHEQS